MTGWTLRREERDGRIVMVPRYDAGPDEDGRRERDWREDLDNDNDNDNEINEDYK